MAAEKVPRILWAPSRAKTHRWIANREEEEEDGDGERVAATLVVLAASGIEASRDLFASGHTGTSDTCRFSIQLAKCFRLCDFLSFPFFSFLLHHSPTSTISHWPLPSFPFPLSIISFDKLLFTYLQSLFKLLIL